MKVETVKWQWAEAVQKKDIYRDYELIRSKTKEEALASIDYLMTIPKGRTYTITVLQDEQYLTYFFHSMPCLGGLAKYKDHHGDKHFMNPYLPRDIRVAFPEGEVVFIGVHRANIKTALNKPRFSFVLSEESPWIDGFGSKDSIIIKDNYFVLTNMNTDPTVFYSLLRSSSLLGGYMWENYTHPKAEILHTMMHYADPRRLAGQKPHKISGGTWAEGYGYTRPYNDAIFRTTLPIPLKDFGTLANNTGTSAGAFDKSFIVETMKSQFGVDIIGKYSPEIDKALIESWDFFKEQAKDLP